MTKMIVLINLSLRLSLSSLSCFFFSHARSLFDLPSLIFFKKPLFCLEKIFLNNLYLFDSFLFLFLFSFCFFFSKYSLSHWLIKVIPFIRTGHVCFKFSPPPPPPDFPLELNNLRKINSFHLITLF